MPENDPSDGEINDVDEFLREFDRIDYDETLVGLVGQGYDVNAPGDQAVADLLGAWRDDVNRVPIDESQLPSVHTASGRMPPASTTGGTLSISDNAARLAVIGSDQGAAGAFQSAEQAMNDQILGTLMNVVEGLPGDVNGAVEALGSSPAAGEIQSMGEHAAGAVEDAISLVQAAIAGIQQAAEHERVFRQGVQAAAQRHGG
jgi:hypothetical protein